MNNFCINLMPLIKRFTLYTVNIIFFRYSHYLYNIDHILGHKEKLNYIWKITWPWLPSWEVMQVGIQSRPPPLYSPNILTFSKDHKWIAIHFQLPVTVIVIWWWKLQLGKMPRTCKYSVNISWMNEWANKTTNQTRLTKEFCISYRIYSKIPLFSRICLRCGWRRLVV